MLNLKSMLLAVMLSPAIGFPYENSVILYCGPGDGFDIRYDRYFENYGIGVSPSLGTFLYSKVFWNSGRSDLTWYTPAIHLSYRVRIYKSHHLLPEIKLVYSYWDEHDLTSRQHKTMTLYGVYPRLSYSMPFEYVRIGVYAGLFGYSIDHWNANALSEYRPLPEDGLNLGLPAFGFSVGYIF